MIDYGNAVVIAKDLGIPKGTVSWERTKGGRPKCNYRMPRKREASARGPYKRTKTHNKSRNDWPSVDWGLGDSEIAKQMGVSRQAVNRQRKSRAPKP